MISKTFKTCIFSLLLISILQAQGTTPPNPNPHENTVPPTPVHESPPESPPQNQQAPPPPVPETQHQNIEQNANPGEHHIQTPEHGHEEHPILHEQVPELHDQQHETHDFMHEESHTVDAGHTDKNLDPVEHETKKQIKKLLSEMTEQDLEAFEAQLAGDTRKYYDEIMAEEQRREQEQDRQYHEQEEQIEQELTPSSKVSKKQTDNFNDEWDKYNDRDISYHEYLFELDGSATQDFRITIPVSQPVTFYGYTYVNKDGVYSVPSNIEGEDPIYVYVYENNHKMVFQKDFYFKYFGAFNGNANSTYLIRFVNPDGQKMIAFNLAVLFQIGHSAEKLTAVDVADHSRRIKMSHEQVVNRMQDTTSRNVMQSENRQKLLDRLERYFIYSIVEILIIAVLCVMQVEFVRKLLSNTSIV